MTIRRKLTLWYAGLLFVSLCLIAGVAYYEWVLETHRDQSQSGSPSKEKEEKQDEVEDYSELTHIILWFALPAAGLGLAGGWWLTRQALAPIAALTRTAAQIHERNLGQQLDRSGNGDELDRLTEVFNAMIMRLGSAFEREREFTLHASHELKTPLTVMRGELETALRDEPLAAPQRERIQSQLDEVQRLAHIVDSLTLLTKADAGNGIPAHALPRVFDRFFRGDAAHGNAVEGCGLGLSIAQWIVRAHDGDIQITSEPQQETVVTVRLPAMTPPA